MIFADNALPGVYEIDDNMIFADSALSGVYEMDDNMIFADNALSGVYEMDDNMIFADDALSGVYEMDNNMIFADKLCQVTCHNWTYSVSTSKLVCIKKVAIRTTFSHMNNFTEIISTLAA